MPDLSYGEFRGANLRGVTMLLFSRGGGGEIVLHNDGDVGWFEIPPPTTVGLAGLTLIASCSEFTPSTREWAKAHSDVWLIKKSGVPAFTDMIRDWWRENEARILSKAIRLLELADGWAIRDY